MNRLFCAFFVLLVVPCLLVTDVHAGDELEQEFQKAASGILDELRSQGIQSTGVLKFAVRVGEGKFPSSFGALNIRLAEKLEIALAMANPSVSTQRNQQIGIARGASDVAAKIDEATHLTVKGREKLFAASYPLAWEINGQSSVALDSLIAGSAQIESNLSTMLVELVLISKTDMNFSPLARFSVPIDLEDLMESGQSFTTRGVFDHGSVRGTNSKSRFVADRLVRQQALAIRNETLFKTSPQAVSQHPLAATSNSPVQLEIWYGNERQSYEFRNGAAFIKTPREGQRVSLKVLRKGNDRKRYGILLQVNGENTLYRERKPAAKAAVWILAPEKNSFTIEGYQVDEKVREQFRVLSDAESEARQYDYGRDIGLISITVFEELSSKLQKRSEAELDLATISETTMPKTTAKSRGDLGTSLFEQLVAQNTRSAIVQGAKVISEINHKKFQRAPTPIMNATVEYYTPSGREK